MSFSAPIFARLVALLAVATLASPVRAAEAAPAPARRVSVFMRDGMRFDPARFEAKPGEALALELTNADTTDMPHNFALLRPGSRIEVVTQAAELGADGPRDGYVPKSSAILAHTAMLAPNASTVLKLRAPDAPGIYPYVCTFPGHGFAMYGALYVGVAMPPLAEDRQIPPAAAQSAIAGGGRRPFVQRIFMPEAGPAAIAVALPGDENYCWDAGQCRLRYIWKGGFIDASENWNGNGRMLAVVPGKPWWRAPEDPGAPPPKFLGYRTTPGGPEFHYRVGGVEAFERIEALPGSSSLRWTIRFPEDPSRNRVRELTPP